MAELLEIEQLLDVNRYTKIPFDLHRFMWRRFMELLAKSPELKEESIPNGRVIYPVFGICLGQASPAGFAYKAARGELKILFLTGTHMVRHEVRVRWDYPISLKPSAPPSEIIDSSTASAADADAPKALRPRTTRCRNPDPRPAGR